MTRAYFVVEGPHDVELVGRLLKWWDLKRVQHVKDLDVFWSPLVPEKFPHGGNLLARVPVPTIFSKGDTQVAVSVAIGDSKLAQMLNTDLASSTFRARELDAVALVLDADTSAPADRWRLLRETIVIPPGVDIVLPAAPNEVSASRIRGGALVLPGDGSQGNLETLLLAAGTHAYPTFIREAATYVQRVHDHARVDAESGELEDFDTTSGRKKAQVAAVAAALKPGKAIQVSIQDNRWVTEAARAVPALEACLQFVASILGAPVPAQAAR